MTFHPNSVNWQPSAMVTEVLLAGLLDSAKRAALIDSRSARLGFVRLTGGLIKILEFAASS